MIQAFGWMGQAKITKYRYSILRISTANLFPAHFLTSALSETCNLWFRIARCSGLVISKYNTNIYCRQTIYSTAGKQVCVSTNFRRELIAPSAREVIIFLLVSREKGGGRMWRGEHGSNLARLETASELKKTVDPLPLQQTALLASCKTQWTRCM